MRISCLYAVIYIGAILFCNVLALVHANILGVDFKFNHTFMPAVAGIAFGSMITQTYYTQLKLKKEKQLVANLHEDLNKSISMIAHDVKTPASGVFSLACMMKDEKQNPFSHEELSEMLYVSSKSILSNIDDIMSMIKFKQVHKQKLKIDNPAKDIATCIALSITSAKQKKIKIIKNITPTLHCVSYSLDVLRDILSNLIGNAIKYSASNTEVVISAENIEYNAISHVKITVTDMGQGLSTEDLTKVFTKFQRLSATPLNGESSTGLGLWIVKSLTEGLNGTVQAHSAGKNQGATFSVLLPMIQAIPTLLL